MGKDTSFEIVVAALLAATKDTRKDAFVGQDEELEIAHTAVDIEGGHGRVMLHLFRGGTWRAQHIAPEPEEE